MEDMARLALVEQNVRDMDTFSKILYELLRYINQILENPHDNELRTMKSDTLRKYLRYEAFVDYLKSIGFQLVKNELVYPKEYTLNNLRLARAAVERKIYFCCGSLTKAEAKFQSLHRLTQVKRPKFYPEQVLTTNNPLLLKIETMFNDVLQYENEDLQALARDQIPLVTLQLMALDDMREHQRQIKTGELEGRDMPFDIALLKVLLSWYKHRYFSWVDAPPCESCGGDTTHHKNSTLTTDTETCRLELYKCQSCDGGASFPRYNSVRTLLRTRRGRCGEWANCFALLCRALGYDTRLVFSTSDHVWCEIWDYDTSQWLHADPCECLLDAPLTYSHGWGKQLSYVIACSRDDVQDVTWRYTTKHREVLSRRTECTEAELLSSILQLRAKRQTQVSEARRTYLAKRCLGELAAMMVERKVECSELHGRVSGSAAWRGARGELRGARGGRVHRWRGARGALAYYVATDRYEVEGCDDTQIETWSAGAYDVQNIFRKVETDWKMAYLAREEECTVGSITWMFEAGPGLSMTSLSVRAACAVYEDAKVLWTVQFDDSTPISASFSEKVTEFSTRSKRVSLTARLRGGRGRVAWQHAQLFRASVLDRSAQLHVTATLAPDARPLN